MAIAIRAEQRGDVAGVFVVNARAFPSDAEARLVDRLRGNTSPQIALVAADASGVVVGHILFTPVEIRSDALESSRAIGLAPMAVSPEHQRCGVGSALVRAGLAACAAANELVVAVLGHPDYYPRFGFRAAWDSGLYYGTPGANPAFMVCELQPGALRGRRGEVVYHAEFDAL